MLIAGFHSGHECSYCVLEDGKPIIHAELERYIRQKEPFGDGLELLFKDFKDYNKIKYFSHSLCTWKGGILLRHPETYKKMWKIITKNNGNFYAPGHHESHAANAFFSSNLNESLIITIDGGGRDYFNDDIEVITQSIWYGKNNKINLLNLTPYYLTNMGAYWTYMTEYLFGLHVGYPYGHQAGTIMAMSAFGNPNKYFKIFMEDKFITNKEEKDWDQIRNLIYVVKNNKNNENELFNMAAALQEATNIFIKSYIEYGISLYEKELGESPKNICLSGGTVLNSVTIGKLLDWFNFENIYIPPVPYDGGLALGNAQYVWHQILDNPRINWEDNFSPYLGWHYSNELIQKACENYSDKIEIKSTNDKEVLELLNNQNIISIFGGKSESGRRALGNRSIIADPRDIKMKDLINEKVKHRQWFRPFAPSILREDVKDWFEKDAPSPYMNLVLKFKPEKIKEVLAVVHKDNSARLQTVTEKDNLWYYNFIKQWKELTGIPIILNTSFNDREPIVETPEDAIKCFLNTDIDYLYFYEAKLLLKKRG